MDIIPAILSDDHREVREMLGQIKNSHKFRRVQIDFVDGKYNNNLTVKPEEIDMTPFLELGFDAHLMVVEENIDNYVRGANKAGFDRIIAQLESVSHPEEFSGLALDIHSPVAAIEPFLGKLEVVIVMAVEPGFGGQEMDKDVIKKVGELSSLRKTGNYRFKICVDGGVTKENLPDLEKAGADEAAVGAGRVLGW